MLSIYGMIENADFSPAKRAAQFPHLKPIDTTWQQAIYIETFTAFIFVFVNLICKDSERLSFAGLGMKN